MEWVMTLFQENPWIGLVLVGIIIGFILKSR